MKKDKILLHEDELTSSGIDIAGLYELDDAIQPAHRDDHYMLIIQCNGDCIWEIDFHQVSLKGPALAVIGPGQVHRYIQISNAEGWLLFIDPTLVRASYREILESGLSANQAIVLNDGDAIITLMALLEKTWEQEVPIKNAIITSQVETIISMATSAILQLQFPAHSIISQKYRIAVRFKQLVKKRFRDTKQVREFAGQLNITPLYLNEAIKKVTGFPASYWIQQEIILEAKRLLYYTDLTILEVAYELGYEQDHAYFSRFFKKHTGITASEFKQTKP